MAFGRGKMKVILEFRTLILWGYHFPMEIWLKYYPYHTSGVCFSFKQYCVCSYEHRLMACFNFSGHVNVCLKQSFSFSIQVTINFREYEDNAIWIRIAWGTPYTKPNQYKTSYVVYHSQTPYVFISASVLRSNLPLLCQVEN